MKDRGEEDRANLPAVVVSAGATNWRCDAGIVMVCDGGATGGACLKTQQPVGDRLADLRNYCRRNPDASWMPDVTTMGLASVWRCLKRQPVAISTLPTDAKGYLEDEWTALP